jgi:predicted ATPase
MGSVQLKRLDVENFRALEKIEIEFDTRVSVLIGPNAIGKTTVPGPACHRFSSVPHAVS